jgi:hypothetical protein
MYDGVPNVQMAIERGRGMRTGLLQGMNTPIDFAGNDKEYIATEQDASSVHFLASKGICIRRNTHCFRLTCEVA